MCIHHLHFSLDLYSRFVITCVHCFFTKISVILSVMSVTQDSGQTDTKEMLLRWDVDFP